MESIDKLNHVLAKLAKQLQHVNARWLVGGSVGLLLQGVQLSAPPRDLDLYADDDEAREIHRALAPYSVDEQVEDRSGLYRSVLSHYLIDGVKVELVGGFEVTACGCFYKVETAYLYEHYAGVADTDTGLTDHSGAPKLMPLEHELLFNVLRNRPDRYEMIALEMRRKTIEPFSRALNDLVARNHCSDSVLQRLNRLLNEARVQ